MTNKLTLPDLSHHRAYADQVADWVDRLTVTTPDAAQSAGLLRQQIQDTIKDLTAKRREITDPINAGVKAITSLFKEPIEALEQARDGLDARLVEWRQIEAQSRELAAQTVEILAADGAALVELQPHIAAAIAPTEKLDGVSYRTKRRARVIDAALVPEQFKIVDLRAIEAAGGDIPGIEWYEESTIVNRRKQ